MTTIRLPDGTELLSFDKLKIFIKNNTDYGDINVDSGTHHLVIRKNPIGWSYMMYEEGGIQRNQMNATTAEELIEKGGVIDMFYQQIVDSQPPSSWAGKRRRKSRKQRRRKSRTLRKTL